MRSTVRAVQPWETVRKGSEINHRLRFLDPPRAHPKFSSRRSPYIFIRPVKPSTGKLCLVALPVHDGVPRVVAHEFLMHDERPGGRLRGDCDYFRPLDQPVAQRRLKPALPRPPQELGGRQRRALRRLLSHPPLADEHYGG